MVYRMEKSVCGSRIVMRKEMERGPHRGREDDWWVKGRLGGAIRYDMSIKRPQLTHPNLRIASGVNILGPLQGERMNQGRARAREKVRPEGMIVYLDSLHRPRSSSPDHRK